MMPFESKLRRTILEKAHSVGCADAVERLTDSAAIRFLQEREGFTPCFGREIPLRAPVYSPTERRDPRMGEKCGEWDCFWREACDAYRTGVLVPIDRHFPDQAGRNLADFQERLAQLDRTKSERLGGGQVGMKLRSFRDLDSATRKMLVAAPGVVVGEQLDDLRAYVLSLSSRLRPVDGSAYYNQAIIEQDILILYSSDAPRLAQWLREASPFLDTGQLSYYPLIERQIQERSVDPRQVRGPARQLPEAYNWWQLKPAKLKSFSAPYLGLLDGEITLSHPEYSPLFSLELPALEDVNYGTLMELMEEFPDELGSTRDFLNDKMQEMQDSHVGSETFGRDIARIQREINGQQRKLNSDLKKSRVRTTLTTAGIGLGAFALTGFALVTQQNGLLAFVGPGGIVTSAGAALSTHLIDRYDLRGSPVYFLWELGRSRKR